jgi:hypothetical protein
VSLIGARVSENVRTIPEPGPFQPRRTMRQTTPSVMAGIVPAMTRRLKKPRTASLTGKPQANFIGP